jgi:membrane protease YdiL (CAAX protease family)
MNRPSRFFSALLSLSIILLAPGLAPYQAAAQTMATRVVVPVGQVGGPFATNFGRDTSSPYGSVAAPLGLQTGIVPSIAPSAALTPVISAAASVNAAVSAAPVAGAPVFSALKPAALAPTMPAAAKSAAPVQALSALAAGGSALTAAVKEVSADAPRVALDGLFEGAEAKPDALAVSVQSAPSDSPRLTPSGPRWVKTFFGPKDGAPRTSIKRTLSVGFLAAVIPIAFTMVTVVVAQLLGYHMHPNYQGPTAGAAPSIISALALWIGAAVMAPMSEEAIFRGGLQGRLAKLAAKLHLNAFVAPAIITSLVFVALHETSDPVLFATRFAHAMVLSYVFKKEGILASMAAHGFFNGLLALSVVLSAAGLPWLGLLTVPAAIYFSFKSRKLLKAQAPEIASGALSPKPLSGWLAIAFAALLAIGYFTIMPNIFWAIGGVMLLINGILKLRKK